MPAKPATFTPAPTFATMVEERIAAKKVGALRVGLLQDGRTWQASFGSVHTSAGEHPADEHTLFEIGSISKTFTALLFADMVVRGEVRVDQPFAELLPAGTQLGTPALRHITLAHLSNHHSGLPIQWPGFVDRNANDYGGVSHAILFGGLARIETLVSEPGTAYAYNNYAVSLLGQVLAAKIGLTYAEAIRQRVLEPLGMHDTFVEIPATERARLVRGHDESGAEIPNWRFGAVAPAGSITSTMPDMLRYVQALLARSGSLGPAIDLATIPREDGPAAGIAVGLGFHFLESGRLTFHNGQSAMHSFLAFDRSRNVAVVILSDRRGMALDALGLEMLHGLRGDPPKPKIVARPHIELDPSQRAALVGTYRVTPAIAIDVREAEGKLTVQVTGQSTNPLAAESATMLIIPGTEIRLEFTLGADRRAEKLVLHQDGNDTTAPRE